MLNNRILLSNKNNFIYKIISKTSIDKLFDKSVFPSYSLKSGWFIQNNIFLIYCYIYIKVFYEIACFQYGV